MPDGRTFRNSLDVNEWTEMEGYELNELEPEEYDKRPEARALLGEEKDAVDADEDASRERIEAQDVFSMDEMVARVSNTCVEPQIIISPPDLYDFHRLCLLLMTRHYLR